MVPLEVYTLVMIACWFLPSNLTSFWRNMSISSIFYPPKSTSMNTQQSGILDNLGMGTVHKIPQKNENEKALAESAKKVWCWFTL